MSVPNQPTTSSPPNAAPSAFGARARVGQALLLRAGFCLVLLSITVGQRFGVNFGSYSLNLALPALYFLLVSAVLSRAALLSLERLVLYLACSGLAVMSVMSNAGQASTASLALVMVMYFPFVFVLKPSALAAMGRDWVTRAFLNVALFCAFAGIAQFYAQFLLRADWLFDFTSYLPPALRGPSGFNTVIGVGSLHKANGFFLREPSGFSLLMALGLIAEWCSYRRSFRLACLGLALLLSYSGTGLLALLLGMLFPLGIKTLGRVSLLLGAGALVWWLFGDVLNLSFTLARLGEFGSERSSAYIRYIAPLRLVADSFFAESWTPWIGHGPGTIFDARPGYEFHDPTWAKLLFEYGTLGFLGFVALFCESLARSRAPEQLRAALFFAWLLMGGHLLSPEQNFLTLALVGWLPALALPPRKISLGNSGRAGTLSAPPLQPLLRTP